MPSCRRSRPSGLVAAAAALGFLGWASGSQAQQPVRVFYEPTTPAIVAEPCVDARRVQSSVELSLSRQVFVERQDAQVHLSVKQRRSPPQARLLLRDRHGRSLGTRRLRAEDCEELTQTAALALSLMLDFNEQDVDEKARLAAERAQQERAAEPKAENDAEQQDATEPEPNPPSNEQQNNPQPATPKQRPSTQPWITATEGALMGLAGTGFHPGIGLGFGAAAGLELKRWFYAEVAGGYFPERGFNAGGGRVQTSRWELALQLCPYQVAAEWLAARFCAVTRTAFASARASGFDAGSEQSANSLVVGPHMLLDARAEPLFVRLDAGLDLAVRRYRLNLAEPGGNSALHEMPLLVFQTGLGVGLRL